MRTRAWVVATVTWLALPAPAAAQPAPSPRLELSGGVTLLTGGGIVDGVGAGWLLGAGWHASDRLAIVLEAGSNRRTQEVARLGITADFHQLMGGARVAVPVGRWRPFAQALAGGARLDLAASTTFPFDTTGRFDETRWAWQLGGGVDTPLTGSDELVLRVGVDYRRVHAVTPFGQTRMQVSLAYALLRR